MKADKYYLREHAFFCVTTRHCIFLDLKKDKYLCIGRAQFEFLRPWLHTAGDRTTGPLQLSCHDEQAHQLAAELIEAGLVSDVPQGTIPPKSKLQARARQCINDVELSGRPPGHLRFLPQFLHAAWTADWKLRRRPIYEIVGDFRARKQFGSPPSTPAIIEHLHRRITTFNALRLIYPRHYLCLFDSLALAEFLAQFKLYPDWVFGVSADPFRAHCWLEAWALVLNDTMEHISTYTPILTA